MAHEIRRAQRAEGPAAMLGIGTANPAYSVLQDEFPDYYFRLTNKEHLTELKDTFRKLCRVLGLERRFFHHTEQLLNANPAFLDGTPSSLDARLDIVAKAAPELAAAAAAKAIARWGRPATDITHLVVATSSEARAPGADLALASLLGLRPGVLRTALQLNGCSAGSAALRLAKELAENNRGARVLVACVELTITSFRAPREGDGFDTLIPQALFGDGAGAVVVGADPVHAAGERPLFEMVSVSQTLVPGSEHLLNLHLGEGGIKGNISYDVVKFAAEKLEPCLLDALGQGKLLAAINGAADHWKWNDLFWAIHPGSLGILDHIDTALRLDPKKLAASRAVIREYGNMLSATAQATKWNAVARGRWQVPTDGHIPRTTMILMASKTSKLAMMSVNYSMERQEKIKLWQTGSACVCSTRSTSLGYIPGGVCIVANCFKHYHYFTTSEI